MLEVFHEIAGSIRRNKMRTIATGFAVASGLFLIIVLQGAGNGIINSFEYNMGHMTFDAIHIFGGMTTMPYEGIREGRYIQMDDRDLEMTRRNFSQYVSNALPTQSVNNMSVSYHENHIPSCNLTGVYPLYEKTMGVEMLKGRFINQFDLLEKRKVAVVDSTSVKSLFKKNEEPIGSSLNISGISYRVVGIYKGNNMESSTEFYLPYTTLSTIYNRGRKIDELTMTIRNIPSVEAMDTFMHEYVRASSYIHTFDPNDERALWIWNQAEDNMKTNTAMNILHTSFWVLGLLTLISGIVGVSNIMLISVKERTHEFGIRRAIGARPRSIIGMVMLESITITGIFGYIGMLIGVFFCEWMDATVGNQTMDMGVFQAKFFVNPTVDLQTCITATIIIIIAGALAGFFPARRAVKVKPIDALRG